jgi:uncharacterized protein (TIGR00730 family)
MNIAVYCASSENAPKHYYEIATKLGNQIAEANHTVYYGGACVGLMGKVADGALEKGGKVVGVLPTFMTNIERHHKGLTESIKVETMQERKRIMFENADMVIALAGGYGTYDELFEVLSLKRLKRFQGRVILVNTNGFYNPMIDMIKMAIQEKFMSQEHLELLEIVNEVGEIQF